MPDTTPPSDLRERLAAPFPADVVGWKPQHTAGNRALVVAYIDARDVMDRLDDVVGCLGWKDAYDVGADGNVICTLSLRVGGEWVAKEDVGGESEQPDDGDKRKAAFSDALKRAAVKWGIGRYLYRLPLQWVDYDPQKKQPLKTPTLPAWALPRPAPASRAANPGADFTGRAPETKLSPEQVAHLEQRLAAKGRKWPQLRQWLDMPGHARIEDVSPEQYARALSALGEEPDAPARKQ